MPIPSGWKTVLKDWASIYYESHTKKQHSDETEKELSVKYIVILVLVSFFTIVILSLLLVVLFKWLSVRKRAKSKDENDNGKAGKTPPRSPSNYGKPDEPRRVKLMRSDSSLSEIDGSGNSSLPPTPLSPLSEEDMSLFTFERGRLEFTLNYDRENECLKTTVVQAHGLPQRHCIYYVEITLLPDRTSKQQTSVRYHNPSPIFEEMFNFDLPFSELPERTLCLRVFELDGFSQRVALGHVLHSFDVESTNYFNVMKMDLELSRGLPQDKIEQESSVGELLVSLCYLPTAGRLTLVVLKCRLFKADNGLPSPFLKVSLMLSRKQVKKIKTSIKRRTLNAVYNEAFIFDVPSQHIGNVSLYARVVNDRENQDVVGKVVIGPSSRTSMGIHHWECMLMSPRKPIAQWHTIL